MYEDYKRGYPREDDFKRSDDEYKRSDPRDEEYRYPRDEVYRRSKDEEYDWSKDEECRCHRDVEVECRCPIECKCSFPKEITVGLKEKMFCAAKSVSGIQSGSFSMSVAVPSNAAITRIYATIRQRMNSPIDNGAIEIRETEGTTTFRVGFSKSPFAPVGGYETSLLEPLCVGPEGATVHLFAARSNESVNADALTLTVVYCPDYCVQPA